MSFRETSNQLTRFYSLSNRYQIHRIKTAAISKIKSPKKLKQSRSFLGSVHRPIEFIPNLANTCHPLQPLLKNHEKLVWTENHQIHFDNIETTIANAAKNTHFIPTKNTTLQKNRHVPTNLLDKVSDEMKKLSDQGHIEKLQACSDQNFISPIVITVKKN